jgi:hypothetical protein
MPGVYTVRVRWPMESRRLVLVEAMVLLVLGACAPARPGAPNTESLPAGAAYWTITLRQTGGFAGVNKTVQVSSDGRLAAADERSGHKVVQQLPPASMAELGQLYARGLSPAPTPQQSACADCFVYDLDIASLDGTASIRLDDTTLADSPAEPLILYLIKVRDTALATP